MNNKKLSEVEEKRQTEIYKSLLSCFRYGRANAIKSKDLEKYFKLNRRELQLMIENIRKSGVCLCADNAGYYFAENTDELERYIKRVEAMAKNTFRNLQSAKTELKRMNEAEQINFEKIGGDIHAKEKADTD